MMLVVRGKSEFVERLAQLREVVVGVLDAGHRGRSIDAGRDGVEAVAGVVLAAVGIARPEHQHERLVARLEHRQHDLAGDIGQIGLLRDVCRGRAGRLGVAGLAVVAARRASPAGDWPWSTRPSFLRTAERRSCRRWNRRSRWCSCCAESVWSNNSVGPSLPMAAVREPLGARHLQDGFFVEIVAVEMLVDIAEHGVDSR